jgi:hypothetical protein
MPIAIRFPSPEEEERARRFQVHKQYLGALRDFLHDEYNTPGQIAPIGVLETQRDLRGF